MAEILKTFPINLDMKRVTAQSTPIPPLVVDDTGNVFEITLTDGGVPVDLSECWVFAQFSLPDGTTSSRSTQDAEDPISIDGDDHNIIKLRLNNVNYSAGKNNCEVEVYSGEGHSTLVTSANFNFDARAKIVNSETAQRDPSFPFLLGLIERVDGALDKLDDAVTAEENRVTAEQERVEAETEREQKVDEVYQAYESGALKGDKGDTGAAGKDGKIQSVDGVQPNSDGTLTLSAVRYDSQTLTEAQKAKARENIGALTGGSDTLTWDFDPTGRANIGGGFYKVSDNVLTRDDVAQGLTIGMLSTDGAYMEMPFDAETVLGSFMEDGLLDLYMMVSVPTDNYVFGEGFVAPERGIYFAANFGDQVGPNGYAGVSSLTINGYKGFLGKAVLASEKGAADGVASLDANGKVEAEQASSAINEQTGDYTLTLDDAGKLVTVDSASDCSVTVTYYEPDFPIGTEIEIAQMGTGVVTIVSNGVTIWSLDGMTSTAGQFAVVCLKKLNETTWLLGGGLA